MAAGVEAHAHSETSTYITLLGPVPEGPIETAYKTEPQNKTMLFLSQSAQRRLQESLSELMQGRKPAGAW